MVIDGPSNRRFSSRTVVAGSVACTVAMRSLSRGARDDLVTVRLRGAPWSGDEQVIVAVVIEQHCSCPVKNHQTMNGPPPRVMDWPFVWLGSAVDGSGHALSQTGRASDHRSLTWEANRS